MEHKDKKPIKCGFSVPTIRGGVYDSGSIKAIKKGHVVIKDTKKKSGK
jgi:hypothetical protein